MPQPKAPPKVTLDQLDDGARALLLAELQAQQATARAAVAVEGDRQIAARTAAIASLMHDRDHLRDCPGGRVEAYEARRPPQPSKAMPAADVTVVRCIECGGSTVLEETYPTVLARLDQLTAAALETAATDDDIEE